MNDRVNLPSKAVDFNDENSNTTSNPTFESVLGARLCGAAGGAAGR